MANHEKLYGVCENKCFVEVIPKANFIVIEGTATLDQPNVPYTVSHTFAELGIKETDKLVVIAAMAARSKDYLGPETQEWSEEFCSPYPKVIIQPNEPYSLVYIKLMRINTLELLKMALLKLKKIVII